MFPLEQAPLEFLLVGAIALVVIGPKDLPIFLRRLGQYVAKMRGMAAEFRASLDELARQSELDELRKEVEALRTGVHDTPALSAPVPALSAEPDPVHDYKPFEDASMGLFSPSDGAPPMSVELTPTAVEPVAKPKRKPRSKPVSVEAPVHVAKPARKAAATKAPVKKVSATAAAAPKPVSAKRPAAKTRSARPAGAKGAPVEGAAE